jgi:hypothetical protein
MRLARLCRISLRYALGSWHRPFDQGSGAKAEALGFGQGEGKVTGELEGAIVWSNSPRRRTDGVWTPNLGE